MRTKGREGKAGKYHEKKRKNAREYGICMDLRMLGFGFWGKSRRQKCQ
jgi:hypothetical protein